MARTLPLTLNRDEVILLADRTLNTDVGTQDMPVVVFRLLVKLGILYLDLVDPSSSQIRDGTIQVTEPEAWLLRSKVNSGDKMASDAQIGVKLLRQLYRVLIDFDADVADLATVEDEGEPMDQWHRDALAVWKAKEGPDDELQPAT